LFAGFLKQQTKGNNMASDRQTIDAAARAWVECGGDKEGLFFCLNQLADRIQELSNEQSQDEESDIPANDELAD
jgi:hypothetical protein